MFYHNLSPTLFKIGSFEIRYYGLIFALGFIIAYFMIPKIAKIRGLNFSKDDTADFLLYILVGAILGARIIYVVVYNFSYYFENPLEVFALWHGGLSFHGGLIGAIIAGWFFCRKKKFDFLELADIVAVPLALGLVFGRIANFINGELVGRISNVSWAVKFPCCEGFRHPSQIYESLKNLIIFVTLWNLKDKKIRKGTMFFTFLLMYSGLRFFVEFFREPDPQLGFVFFGLTMGQVLNMVMFALSIFSIVYIQKTKNQSGI